MTYNIGDLIIRIKNGYMAKKETIIAPYSILREQILKKLIELEYIKEYRIEGDKKKTIIIDLLYLDGMPAITDVKIMSKPGRRWYVGFKQLKSVLGGMGVSILSTPQGMMTNNEAKKMKIGGELLFNIW